MTGHEVIEYAKKLVEERDSMSHELGEIRATLIVNFERNGRHNHYGVEIENDPNVSTLALLLDVLKQLTFDRREPELASLLENDSFGG